MQMKLDFIKMLICDAESEIKYIREYEKYREDYNLKFPGNGYDSTRRDHPFWDMRPPSRARIKDDMKMIRRLTIEISKEDI